MPDAAMRDYHQVTGYQELSPVEMHERSSAFLATVSRRRSVRHFSAQGVPDDVIENCIRAAATAPNGANQQPWHFAVVKSSEIKRRIREAAEAEERAFYSQRAPQDWLDALAPLGTDANKPFLEIASHLIVIFSESHGVDSDGKSFKHYYALESVGLATGILITALHHAGVATLTHTPSPMKFLNEILDRPRHQRPFILLVVGYPAPDAQVPDIQKKELAQIVSVH